MVKFRRESDRRFIQKAESWSKDLANKVVKGVITDIGGPCYGCDGISRSWTKDKLNLENFYPKFNHNNSERLKNKFGLSLVLPDSVFNHISEVEIWLCSDCQTEMEDKKISDIAAKQAHKLAIEKAEREAAAAAKKKAEAEAAAKKAAEEARALKIAAQKAQQEAKAERSAERQSMVKAGIPDRIVALWVNGILTKSEMFKMLQVFGDKLPAWDRELAQISEPNAKPNQGRGDTIICPDFMSQIENIDDRVVLLHELITEFPSDMVKFTFTKSMTKDQLDFLKKCTKEDDLYNLYLAIVNQGFDIDFAAKLVNDCGYENNTEALQEVIDGANWEAVAVKHGFFQI